MHDILINNINLLTHPWHVYFFHDLRTITTLIVKLECHYAYVMCLLLIPLTKQVCTVFCNLWIIVLKLMSRIDIMSISCGIDTGECHKTLLGICQHCLKYWLGAIRHQAFTRASVDSDLRCHMVSLATMIWWFAECTVSDTIYII